MGDRSGLPKIDRTNGFDDGRDYMRVKKSKLAQQNDKIREALRSRYSSSKSDLFKGISINVNGRTQPTADELKRLILLNGGDYHPYYRYQTTKFMIATNLSTARMKTLRPDDRVVRPEWITESIEAKCLLPYQDYQLFSGEPRGKEGTVRSIDRPTTSIKAITDTSGSTSKTNVVVLDADDNLPSIADSYATSYRKNSRNKQSSQETTKSRDIREMFSKCVRSIENSDSSDSSNAKKNFNISSQSSDKNNSNNDDNNDDSNRRKQEGCKDALINQDSNQSVGSNKTSRSSNSQEKKSTTKMKTLTMSDFVIKGAKSNRFPAPKVAQDKKSVANICGLTNIDQIISLLNEWVGCPEGVKDDDTACVTKFFFDLMSEKEYHNKLYEILDAFKQRVIQYDEAIWINVYNNLIETIKSELTQGSEASQNLNQLLSKIDLPNETPNTSNESISRGNTSSQLITSPSLPTIPEIDID